jgi:4-hydroxythreonine-4-phosphate dehydrogenase
MSGAISGMVTAPISKEGFHRAGIRVAGHTELLERLTGTPESAMFLVGGGLRVVPVTRHVPLSTVPRLVTADRIVSQGVLANRALGWLRVPGRRLAVCGLNPHAGEGGKIGTEEARSIVPAVRRLRCLGVKADGPVPADSAFARCLAGEYAGVLAMYHDQGLGPLKTVAFDSGVNITVGLPIVRTSPCHGTAFEIAGKNRADSASMISAIATACELASRPNPFGR